MQNLVLFPTSSSFFLHDGFLARMRLGAAKGGGESKKS
jgi:hypothetical protein